jgi:hypothetical protein
LPDRDDQETPVLSDEGVRVLFGVTGDGVDVLVGLLDCAAAVIVNGRRLGTVTGAVLAGRVAAVVKALTIARPRCAGELAARNRVVEVLSGIDVADAPGLPIGAAVRCGVGEPLAVGARGP